jgi:hypothetical protein
VSLKTADEMADTEISLDGKPYLVQIGPLAERVIIDEWRRADDDRDMRYLYLLPLKRGAK